MPPAADAKLTPSSMFAPLVVGAKYGGGNGSPIFSATLPHSVNAI